MEPVAPPTAATDGTPLILPSRATPCCIDRGHPTHCPSRCGLVYDLRGGGSSADLASLDDGGVAHSLNKLPAQLWICALHI
ncbi:hypothetical protein NL676_000953 [Syzygium grande]|nr:hypothetical protein NL676_000953 [Syzygium grande]